LTNWGSVGLFGPLTIRPDYWDKGDQKIKGITGLMFTFLTIGVNVALLIVSIIFSTPICKQALSLRNDFIFEVESFMSQ
jgi:hypothetical protein